MPIEYIDLREKLHRVRLSFDKRVADALMGRHDLSQAQIQKEFGVSESVIRRVIKQFNIGARRRGPKRRQQVLPKE